MINSKVLNEANLKSMRDDIIHKGYHLIHDFFDEEFTRDIKRKVIELNKK